MLQYVKGDFFDYDADIRINTVNCVGVMGAGVALEFKNRYPDMFKEYVKVCKRKEIEPGKPYLWENYDLFSKCIIVNLPTKIHWRNPSEYEYIEKDLVWLREFLSAGSNDTTVTLPALGCGHGGLDWSIVRKKIEHYLSDIDARILVFEPGSSNSEKDNPHYGIRLINNNINIIYENDSLFHNIKGNSSSKIKEIYYIGNTDIFELKKVNLICGNTISEKEESAMLSILSEMQTIHFSVVLGLNNNQHISLAKKIMSKGIKMILVLPYGISNFRHYNDLQSFDDSYILLSYLPPNKGFRKYEYINSLNYRNEISDVILYGSDKIDDIRRDKKYILPSNVLFYINYWNENMNEFEYANAGKIGINPKSHKPTVEGIVKYLSGGNFDNI